MMLVADMRDAKRLSTTPWSSLSPTERERVHELLGIYYRAYDCLAMHTAFTNGRIEQLEEALSESSAQGKSDG